MVRTVRSSNPKSGIGSESHPYLGDAAGAAGESPLARPPFLRYCVSPRMSMFIRPLLKKVFSLREHRETEAVKPFLEHLEDLRTMLFKIVVTLGLTMMVCFGFRFRLMHLVEMPLPGIQGFDMTMLRGLAPGDSMTISIQLAFYAGIIISFPVLLYFLADFVLPALTEKEKRLVLPGVGVSFGLFLTGVLFCFKVVLPMTLRWLWNDPAQHGDAPGLDGGSLHRLRHAVRGGFRADVRVARGGHRPGESRPAQLRGCCAAPGLTRWRSS